MSGYDHTDGIGDKRLTDTHDNGREEQWRWVAVRGRVMHPGVHGQLPGADHDFAVMGDDEQAERLAETINTDLKELRRQLEAARAQAGLAQRWREALEQIEGRLREPVFARTPVEDVVTYIANIARDALTAGQEATRLPTTHSYVTEAQKNQTTYNAGREAAAE